MSKPNEPCATCAKNNALRGSSTCLTCWKLWWDATCNDATKHALAVKQSREVQP